MDNIHILKKQNWKQNLHLHIIGFIHDNEMLNSAIKCWISAPDETDLCSQDSHYTCKLKRQTLKKYSLETVENLQNSWESGFEIICFFIWQDRKVFTIMGP